MAVKHLLLSVLFFRDPDDPTTWIAQALEKDIAASGADLPHARQALEKTLEGYVMMARRMHCEPFERLQPAPQVFWDIWRKQAPEQVHLERVESVPAFMLPVVTYDEIPA